MPSMKMMITRRSRKKKKEKKKTTKIAIASLYPVLTALLLQLGLHQRLRANFLLHLLVVPPKNFVFQRLVSRVWRSCLVIQIAALHIHVHILFVVIALIAISLL
jgi:hypothetical protein